MSSVMLSWQILYNHKKAKKKKRRKRKKRKKHTYVIVKPALRDVSRPAPYYLYLYLSHSIHWTLPWRLHTLLFPCCRNVNIERKILSSRVVTTRKRLQLMADTLFIACSKQPTTSRRQWNPAPNCMRQQQICNWFGPLSWSFVRWWWLWWWLGFSQLSSFILSSQTEK